MPIKLIFEVSSDVSTYEVYGYMAPFPSYLYKAGAYKWPLLIPLSPTDPMAIEMMQVKNFLKTSWKKPVLFGYSDKELFTLPGRKDILETFPNACEMSIKKAGHFLQEDQGPFMSSVIIDFINMGDNVCIFE